ncbi:MAG: quinolinate synthase NadA, partial [bacterium]|nr:quinolinate synthase NadA [bacterium]
PSSAVCLWDRDLPDGGLTSADIQSATLIAWNGCCPIHAGYTTADLNNARERLPNAKMLIHPEAPSPVAAQADKTGSTKAIIDAVKQAVAGERLLIGTEDHLVQRLIANYPELTIEPIRPIICEDMGLTTPEQLLRVLKDWPKETLVRVEDALIADARCCVQRMLEI